MSTHYGVLMSDVDEYALWSPYASLKDGVAVQSTVLRLITALDTYYLRYLFLCVVHKATVF